MTTQLRTRLKTLLTYVLIFAVFVISRVWVLQNPPASYSDVDHDYERYANIWRYGLSPYREIFFEYPPAAVPLISLPLDVDQLGIGYYYLNYRIEIFIFELIIFGFILAVVSRLPTNRVIKGAALTFYILAGVFAKDFWYEGLDLIFFGSFSVMLCWIYLARQDRFIQRVVTWALFWLSVAIKVMTGPLMLPILFTRKLELKKELLAMATGAALVWGLPVAIYRSSLQVFMVGLSNRPMKYGAFGSYIIDVINKFTGTEVRVDAAPDFQWVGPVSTQVYSVVKIAFPLAIILVLVFMWKMFKKHAKQLDKPLEIFTFLLRCTLLYVFVLFLTGKTFSSPFHIWYVPLLALYPFKNLKQQLCSYALAFLMLGLDTTSFLSVPNVSVAGPLMLSNVRDAFRFIPMGIFIVIFVRSMYAKTLIRPVKKR